MPKIDGEKFACSSCVRGHRVSGCQHHDRPLQHINKKGRPTTQCADCRNARRTKSAHVKCDCGEHTRKCVHLQPTVKGHGETCCCNHGGRCTCCSGTKERSHLGTLSEADSDSMLTFDEHGHHKPTHKPSKASRTVPYPRPRRRSSDASGRNRSMENLVVPSPPPETATLSQAQDQRLTKSEAASPLMTGSSSSLAPVSIPLRLPPLDTSTTQSWPSNSFESFGPFGDHEAPMFSAGLQSPAPVDWAFITAEPFMAKDLETFAPSNFSQPQSFAFDQAPSAMTSGDVSEVEDYNPEDEFDPTGTFSRTNTSSTGFGLTASQENLTGVVFNPDFDYSKVDKDDGSKFYTSAYTHVMATPISAQDMAECDAIGETRLWPSEADYAISTSNDLQDLETNFWFEPPL